MKNERGFFINPKHILRTGLIVVALGGTGGYVRTEINNHRSNSDNTITLKKPLSLEDILLDFPQPKITFPNLCKDCVDPEILKAQAS